MQRILCQTAQVGGVLYRIAVCVCGSSFGVAWLAAFGLTILNTMKGGSKSIPVFSWNFPSNVRHVVAVTYQLSLLIFPFYQGIVDESVQNAHQGVPIVPQKL